MALCYVNSVRATVFSARCVR